MKEMKENDRGGKGDHGGEMLGLRPMNLTTMLSNAGSRDLAHVVSKRNSDSSLSPRSPPGMDHDSRDDIVDPRIERDHDMDDDIGRLSRHTFKNKQSLKEKMFVNQIHSSFFI